jgi:photosystem II stability/assembly factor-like uncharacterized protein
MINGNASRLIALMVVLVCTVAMSLQAQWHRLETLDGISPRDLAATEDGTVYVVANADAGFYYSTDRGDSWTHRTGLDSLLIGSLYAHGNDLYLRATSRAGGPGWQRIYRLAAPDAVPEAVRTPHAVSVGSFCIADNGWFYLTHAGNPATDSVYVSQDGGQSWASVCEKFSDVYGKNALQVDASQQIWSYDQWRLARWDQGSGQWLQWEGLGSKNSGTRWYFFRPDGDLYVNNGTKVVRLPRDGGAPVTIYTSSSPSMNLWMTASGALLIAERNPDYTIAAHSYRITTDEGATWEYIDTLRPKHPAFFGESQGTIYGNSGYDILRSSDFGRTFKDCSAGIAAAMVQDYEIRGERIHAITSRYALSGDAGGSWVYHDFESVITPGEFQVTSDGTFFENRDGFRISHDSARSWIEPLPGDTGRMVAQFFALDDLILCTLYDGSIRRSLDGGVTWEKVHQSSGNIGSFIHVHGSFYSIWHEQLLRSTDEGATWDSTMLPAMENPFLFGNQRMLFLSASSILWSSTDHGDSWTPLPLDTLARTFVSVAANDQGHLAATRFGGEGFRRYADIVLSTDDGRSWKKITGDLPTAFTEGTFGASTKVSFTASNKLFLSVPWQGLYYRDLTQLYVETESPVAAPLSLELWPTIGASEIHVRVHSDADARLRVTTITGVCIVDASLPAGQRTQSIDVRFWPAGTYFLHAVTGGKSSMKTFMVVR